MLSPWYGGYRCLQGMCEHFSSIGRVEKWKRSALKTRTNIAIIMRVDY